MSEKRVKETTEYGIVTRSHLPEWFGYGKDMEMATASVETPVMVSVIIPVYNAEKALERCIKSILAQTYTDFELLLMDDGSRDKSAEIIDRYAQMDPRVRAVHKKNSGVSDTRNQGMDLARGKYIQFVDADDWLAPEALMHMQRTAEESRADMVVCDFYRVVGERTSVKGSIDEDGLITREQYAEYMARSPADYYYGVCWNKLFRRDILEAHHLRMDPSLSFCEDFIFDMEYILHAERIYILRIPLYYYVKTEGSLVAQGLNVPDVVRMKLNVIEYYSRFYKNIYSPTDYALKRPIIYSFLVGFAHDDAALPGLPGTRKLGEEHVSGVMPGDRKDLFMVQYYLRGLMNGALEDAARRFDLEKRDLRVLCYLYERGSAGNLRELGDYAGMPALAVGGVLEMLILRKLVYSGTGRLQDAAIADVNAPVIRAIAQIMEDTRLAALEGLSEEDKKAYERILAQMFENLGARISLGRKELA